MIPNNPILRTAQQIPLGPLRSGPSRTGLSLLEVILALSILAFSTAYLAQSMRLATNNALKAQDLAKAELAAESVLNQVIAGVIPSDPVSWTPYVTANGDSQWMYQLQNVPTEVTDMLGFQVAVQKTSSIGTSAPVRYDLYANRWIIDPALELDIPPEEDAEAEQSGTSSSGTSSGSSAAGAGGGQTSGAAAPPAGAGFGGGGGGAGFGGGGGRGGQGAGGRGGGQGGGGQGGGGGRGGGQGGGGRGGQGGGRN